MTFVIKKGCFDRKDTIEAIKALRYHLRTDLVTAKRVLDAIREVQAVRVEVNEFDRERSDSPRVSEMVGALKAFGLVVEPDMIPTVNVELIALAARARNFNEQIDRLNVRLDCGEEERLKLQLRVEKLEEKVNALERVH